MTALEGNGYGGFPAMYGLRKEIHPFLTYELADQEHQSWLRVCPERGGIITGFGVRGQEILHLDETTLANREKNIRGGIPILFPICGPLDGSQYCVENHTFELPQHGIARRLPWTVTKVTGEDEAVISLCLQSDDETLSQYPFAFELQFTYRVQGNVLRVDQVYQNNSDVEMPMYAGFHPYFRTSLKNIACQSDASRYLDCNDGLVKTWTGQLDLTDMVEAAILIDSKSSQIFFTLPDSDTVVQIRAGSEFRYFVLWSVPGQPFVCVEPWMARPNAMNDGLDVNRIAPRSRLCTWMEIAVG